MKKTIKGFTLVELMTAVAIIGIILTISLYSFMEAKKNSRDEKRATDLAQYQLALKLYLQKNGEYPNYRNGVRLGIGNAIDAELEPFLSNLPTDPSQSATYSYVYDSAFNCGGRVVPVVYAMGVERPGNSNFDSVCSTDFFPYNKDEEDNIQLTNIIDLQLVNVAYAKKDGEVVDTACIQKFVSYYNIPTTETEIEQRLQDDDFTSSERAFFEDFADTYCDCSGTPGVGSCKPDPWPDLETSLSPYSPTAGTDSSNAAYIIILD